MIVVDISSKGNRIYDLDHTRVNENATHDQTYDATKDIAPEKIHLSKANIEHRTPNFEPRMRRHAIPVRRSMFGVQRSVFSSFSRLEPFFPPASEHEDAVFSFVVF